MRFLIDAQLPAALARWLETQGHEAEHVSDCGLGGALDGLIWIYAEHAGAAIVTKDEDFARRKARQEGGPIVVWVRLGNTRRRELLRWFQNVFPDLLDALGRGETLVEIARGPA